MGFDIKDFFRNPHSRFPYDFSILNKKNNLSRNRTDHLSNNYLKWALHIGRLICKQAIVINKKGITYGHWVSLIEDEAGGYEYRLTDDSYGEGRLGILFFLAKLYSYFPDEYLFKFICKTVLMSIRKNKNYGANDEHIIKNIEKFLKNGVSVKFTDTKPIVLPDHPLAHEIYQLLDETNSYSKVNNEAPQPIINKAYSAIGLMLLALHEGDIQELNYLERYYAKETLLKIINHVKF